MTSYISTVKIRLYLLIVVRISSDISLLEM